MNELNSYITIASSIAIYAAFAWFLGNRFLQCFIKHSLIPAACIFVILPILAMPGFIIFLAVMYLIGITDGILEYAVYFGILTAIVGSFIGITQIKLTEIVKDFPFIVFAIPGVVRYYLAEFITRVKRSSNSVILVLQEKTAKEAVKGFFSNFNDETKHFPFVSMVFLCFVIFFLSVTSELWPISNFVYWNWHLKYSNFQKFIGNCIFSFSLFLIFYASHRQRLKAIFSDFILVLNVAQKNGKYFLVKGRGEIVDGDLTDDQLIRIESLNGKSAIWFAIDDGLCLFLDSRIEFKDFLTLMRSVREGGVDMLADKLGISVENFDEDDA